MEQIGERYLQYLSFGRWLTRFGVIDFDAATLSLFKSREKSRDGSRPKKVIDLRECLFYDAVKRKKRPHSVRIRPKKSRGGYYFSFDSLRTVDEIKVELEECDGAFEGLDRSPPRVKTMAILNPIVRRACELRKRGVLSEKKVLKWNSKDTMKWLQCINQSEEIMQVFSEYRIDGSVILNLDRRTLVSLGVEDATARVLTNEINDLKVKHIFSRPRFVVRTKYIFDRHISYESNEVINALSHPFHFQQYFLRTYTLPSPRTNIFPVVLYVKLELKKGKSIGNTLIRRDSSRPRLIVGMSVGPWYFEWNDSELVIPKRWGMRNHQKTPCIGGTCCGVTHVGFFKVKNLYEFEPSSPKRKKMKKSFEETSIRKITDTLSRISVEWNTSFRYTEEEEEEVEGEEEVEDEKKGKKKGNSISFLNALLKSLRIMDEVKCFKFMSFLGELKEKYQNCRLFSFNDDENDDQKKNTGRLMLLFEPSEVFRMRFVTKRSYVFESHDDFDLFCAELMEKCPEIRTEFASEYSILKSYDRIFWMHHLKNKDEMSFYPLDPPEEVSSPHEFPTGCPFGDPRETQVFL